MFNKFPQKVFVAEKLQDKQHKSNSKEIIDNRLIIFDKCVRVCECDLWREKSVFSLARILFLC